MRQRFACSAARGKVRKPVAKRLSCRRQ
jgi:hypothetical protein